MLGNQSITESNRLVIINYLNKGNAQAAQAARAGESGRGFTVVASELKALAAQTARASEEISTQIAGMQSATEDSAGAIKEIGATIVQAEIANAGRNRGPIGVIDPAALQNLQLSFAH